MSTEAVVFSLQAPAEKKFAESLMYLSTNVRLPARDVFWREREKEEEEKVWKQQNVMDVSEWNAWFVYFFFLTEEKSRNILR